MKRNDAGLARFDLLVPRPGGGAAASGPDILDFQPGRADIGKHKVMFHRLPGVDLAEIVHDVRELNFRAGAFDHGRRRRWRSFRLGPA